MFPSNHSYSFDIHFSPYTFYFFSVIVWRYKLSDFSLYLVYFLAQRIWSTKKYSPIAIQFFDSLNLFKSIREFSRVKNNFFIKKHSNMLYCPLFYSLKINKSMNKNCSIYSLVLLVSIFHVFLLLSLSKHLKNRNFNKIEHWFTEKITKCTV